MTTTTTHPYFVAKARAAFHGAGGVPDRALALAAWAEQTCPSNDPARGVIVGEDGTIVAETRHCSAPGKASGTYLLDADRRRLGLDIGELGLALGQLPRIVGQQVVHFRWSELCRGAGRHIPHA